MTCNSLHHIHISVIMRLVLNELSNNKGLGKAAFLGRILMSFLAHIHKVLLWKTVNGYESIGV